MTDGPFFDDLTVGEVLEPAPTITIGPGEAALYQSISGDPLAVALSRPLAERVTGAAGALVNPTLALHVSIGQSTVATRRVIANLFYRGVRLRRVVRVGDTLSTRVEIRGLREGRRRPDRPPRGTALLGITTTDQEGRVVVDYERCPMLPFRAADAPETGHADDLGAAETELDWTDWEPLAPDWDLSPLPRSASWEVGEVRTDPMRDTVSGALELVRLTQNQAAAHRDPARGQRGRRLVYGGHTIGLAQASLGRLLPSTATVLGWLSCDHLGPVFEDDVLEFRAELLGEREVANGRLLACSVTVRADRDGELVDVLDHRPVVLAR
ncbi:MAG: acyl dehydratase [Actinomycetota bacterium]